VRRLVVASALVLTFAACGKLEGTGGPATPLVSFTVTFSGDVGPLRPPGPAGELRLALVWGDQWLTEPFCVLPPESAEAAAVIAAGCRDPLGFVPLTVGASVPLAPDGPTSLTLEQLPSADVMVGDITARVAYGSLVVFEDHNANGTLDLSRPFRQPAPDGDEGRGPPVFNSPDVIFGASFVTMTAPDRRVAYREGGPPTGAFYPRAGCPPPPPGFSIVGAGGFSRMDALTATLAGTLPQEDPATCTVDKPATTTAIEARPPAEVQEVGCDERATDSSIRYREPPPDSPDMNGRVLACAHLPSFDTTTPSSLIQLVVSGRASDHCKGLTHFVLRGCREKVDCPVPDWDFTANPPAWWPCPQ
jgi:hypothetical protein